MQNNIKTVKFQIVRLIRVLVEVRFEVHLLRLLLLALADMHASTVVAKLTVLCCARCAVPWSRSQTR